MMNGTLFLYATYSEPKRTSSSFSSTSLIYADAAVINIKDKIIPDGEAAQNANPAYAIKTPRIMGFLQKRYGPVMISRWVGIKGDGVPHPKTNCIRTVHRPNPAPGAMAKIPINPFQ